MNFGERSQQEFTNKLYTGFGIFECVAINPTKAEIATIKGYAIDETKEGFKDFDYEGKDAQGNEFVDIVFYIRAISHEDKPIMPVRFRLVDKDVSSEKDGVVKYQYVNQVGQQSWVDDKNNLLDKFKKVIVKGEDMGTRQIRRAIQGEGNLYNFLQAWLDKGVAFFGENSKDTDIFIDKKKAFRNIDKYVDSELKPLIGSENVGNFNALAMVGISEKDGKVNHFQNVYNNFWPEWKFKSMVGAVTSGKWDTDDLKKTHDYLVKSLSKSAYSLGWIKLFSESEHQNAGNETFKEAIEAENIDDTSY